MFWKETCPPFYCSLAVKTNGLMRDTLAVGRVPCLVELTGRQFFLPVYVRSVRKLPPGAWVYFSKSCRMQAPLELEGKNLFFRFSLLFFSPHIGLLPIVPKDLDKIPLCIFPIPAVILMKPSPPTEENPVPDWRLRGHSFQFSSPFLQGNSVCVR